MLKYILRNESPSSFPCPPSMPPALHRLLTARGIASAAAAEAFLHPGEEQLTDPMLLSDMGRAVARIRAALSGGEVVCVYGDYDVDGVCASAILSGHLKSLGCDARVYLPSRHSEGYGLNEHAVREIAGWAKLLVTVDCGIASHDLVGLAKSLGLDVIVTDHHRPGDALPDCPTVNPLLGGYPFPYLCGAGVAWKLVWALSGRDAAMPWVDVAALATVADVVSLTGENRVIVALGLAAINRAPRTGVAALIGAAGLSGKPVTSTAIGFQLAPRLNAGGRLGSAERSLALILETDPAKARVQAEALDQENARRKTVENHILAEAEAQLADFDFCAHRAIVLAGKDWNPGVIGLAASRLLEKYNYPVILLSDQGEKLTGSCRSIEGVDIFAALTGCADTLIRFGGHRQAAGLTLAPERLSDFIAALDAWIDAHVYPWDYVPAKLYDGVLDFGEVTPGLIVALDAIQPTGFGNPAPVFRARAEVVEARAVGADGAHLKLTLAQDGHRLPGIAFREGPRAGSLSGGADVLFVPKLNDYMGRVEPQAEVKALADWDVYRRLSAKLGDEGRLQCEFLTEIFYNKKIAPSKHAATPVDEDAVQDWLVDRPQGTLLVTTQVACAGRLLHRFGFGPPDVAFGEFPRDPRAFNAVCVCPVGGRIPAGYRRIVLCGAPEQCLPEGTTQQVLRLGDEGMAWLPDLDMLRAAYTGLARLMKRPVWFASLFQLTREAAGEAGLDESAMAAAILAMADMGLFELALDASPVALRRTGVAKARPEDSPAWRWMDRWRQGNWNP